MQHTEKNEFKGDLFLHYSCLKPLLSHLSRVAVFPPKPFLGNVFPGVLLNLRKSLSEPLFMGLRTSVKYYEFSKPS